jgi:hypothetical protein
LEIAPRFPHSHSFDDDSYIKERSKPPPLRINNLGWAKLNRRNGPNTVAKRTAESTATLSEYNRALVAGPLSPLKPPPVKPVGPLPATGVITPPDTLRMRELPLSAM